MSFYAKVLRPLLFQMDAEAAHRWALRGLGWVHRYPALRDLLWTSPWGAPFPAPSLRVSVFGRTLPSPVGLAAGFDKDGTVFNAMAPLGFSFVEVGTIVPKPQSGNLRPRLFRLPEDQALINRMGFNSEGLASAWYRLQWGSDVVGLGINIGKNKETPLERAVDDYVAGAHAFGGCPAMYLAVNVSSPNTPGLRTLQDPSALRAILVAVRETLDAHTYRVHRLPLAVKLSPDMADEDLDAVADLAMELKVDALIATNTTVSRRISSLFGHDDRALATPHAEVVTCGPGGLSGPPIRHRARQVVARLYRRVGGQIPIIGVGGISNAWDAFEMVGAGASLVQLYTAMIYQGPRVAQRICAGLSELVHRSGVESVQDWVGKTADAELEA